MPTVPKAKFITSKKPFCPKAWKLVNAETAPVDKAEGMPSKMEKILKIQVAFLRDKRVVSTTLPTTPSNKDMLEVKAATVKSKKKASWQK